MKKLTTLLITFVMALTLVCNFSFAAFAEEAAEPQATETVQENTEQEPAAAEELSAAPETQAEQPEAAEGEQPAAENEQPETDAQQAGGATEDNQAEPEVESVLNLSLDLSLASISIAGDNFTNNGNTEEPGEGEEEGQEESLTEEPAMLMLGAALTSSAAGSTSFEDGKTYLITYTFNEVTDAIILTDTGSIDVTPFGSGTEITDNMKWTATGSSGKFKLSQGSYNLYYGKNDLSLTTTTEDKGSWNYSDGKISYKAGKDTYYICYGIEGAAVTKTETESGTFTIDEVTAGGGEDPDDGGGEEDPDDGGGEEDPDDGGDGDGDGDADGEPTSATGFTAGNTYVIVLKADNKMYAVTNNSGTIVATELSDIKQATDAMKWVAASGSSGVSLANDSAYLGYGDSLSTRTDAARNWAFSNGQISYDSKGTKYYAGVLSGTSFLCGTDSSAAGTYEIYQLGAGSGSSDDDDDDDDEGGGSSSDSITYKETKTLGNDKYIAAVDPAAGKMLKLDQGSFSAIAATVSGTAPERTMTPSKGTSIEVALVDGGAYTLRMSDPPGTWNYIFVKDGVLTADDKDNPGEASSFCFWNVDADGHLYYTENETKYYLSASGATVSTTSDGATIFFGGSEAASTGGGSGSGGGSKSTITVDEDGPQITVEPQAVAVATENTNYAAPVFSITVELPEGSAAENVYFQWYVNGEASGDAVKVAATTGAITNEFTASQLTSQDAGVYPVYCEVYCNIKDESTGETVKHTNTSAIVNFIVSKGFIPNSFLTFSDVHESFTNIGEAIANTIKTDGLAPSLIVCTGDWANGHYSGGDETSDNYATTMNTFITRLLGQMGGIDSVFVAGNHDNGTAAAAASIEADLGAAEDYDGAGVIFDSSVAKENGTTSKNNEGLIVYGINYDNLDNGSYNGIIEDLEAYLESLRKDYAGQTIVISSHTGLHKLDDWGGGNSYNVDRSNEMVQLLNKYAETGMNIQFYFGHDHSKGEAELCLNPGDTITSVISYSEQTTEDIVIKFTYGHAGYITSSTGGNERYSLVTWDNNGSTRKMMNADGEEITALDFEADSVTEYQMLEGQDGKFDGNDAKTLSFRANGSLDVFTGVMIDGKKINENAYTTAKGSTIVNLKPEFLNTLENGEHTIKMMFTNGEVETKFTVANAKPQSDPTPDPGKKDDGGQTQRDVPKTDDSSNAALWVIMMIAAMAAIGGAVVYKKKEN